MRVFYLNTCARAPQHLLYKRYNTTDVVVCSRISGYRVTKIHKPMQIDRKSCIVHIPAYVQSDHIEFDIYESRFLKVSKGTYYIYIIKIQSINGARIAVARRSEHRRRRKEAPLYIVPSLVCCRGRAVYIYIYLYVPRVEACVLVSRSLYSFEDLLVF